MFKSKHLPVWIGIILLSGMFLMGQDTWVPPTECIDFDEDGYGNPASDICPNPEWDCNDNNPEINPGVIEGPPDDPVCTDWADNDCDGYMDFGDIGCQQCQEDADCDDSNLCTDDACVDHICISTNNSVPCDDADDCTMDDVCADGSCSGEPQDLDDDTYVSDACGGDDCDDLNPDVNPGAPEGPPLDPTCYDQFDNDCDDFMDMADDACWECEDDEDCDDGNGCTIDICEPGHTCVHEPIPDCIVVVHNSASDASCNHLCGVHDGRSCISVGTDAPGTNGIKWEQILFCVETGANCSSVMMGTFPSICGGSLTQWTNCRCSY